MANGAGSAVQLATKLGEVDFPEFTAALITSTFDALLKAHIHQMKTYADILEDIAMTLADYVKAYRNTVSDEEIDEWFENHGLPIIKKNSDTSGLSHGDVQAIVSTLLKDNEEIHTDPPFTLSQNQNNQTTPNNQKYTLKSNDDTNTDPPKIGGNTLRERVAEIILARRQNLLRELVRMGLVRLVVDFGEIETRILFSVYGTSTRSRSTYESETQSREWGLEGEASYKGGKFSASISGYYKGKKIKARTSSSYDRDTTGSRIDIFGRVYIRFKSDYAPLNVPEE